MTSKLGRKEPSEKKTGFFKGGLEKARVWMDENRRTTAIAMFATLLLSFSYLMFRVAFLHQNNLNSGVNDTFKEVNKSFGDSARSRLSEDMEEYIMLKQIQMELEGMMNDTSQIDTVRVGEILKYLTQ
jgi:hypothetical protein